MIIDAFPYAGEKIILELRLNTLNPVISKFIIVESNATQSGLPKPYYFEEHRNDFKEFEDKIVYIKLDDSNVGELKPGDWSNEFFVRRAIVNYGIPELRETVELNRNDICIVSDCDEIPKPEVIQNLAEKDDWDTICLNQYFCSYYLNVFSEFRSWGWHGSILTRLFVLQQYDIQHLRNIKDNLPHTGNSGEGWHLSNLLTDGFESLYSKWLRNVEPHDRSVLDLDKKEQLKKDFEKCLYGDYNFFFCDKPNKREIPLKLLDISEIIPYALKNNKYSNLMFPE